MTEEIEETIVADEGVGFLDNENDEEMLDEEEDQEDCGVNQRQSQRFDYLFKVSSHKQTR